MRRPRFAAPTERIEHPPQEEDVMPKNRHLFNAEVGRTPAGSFRIVVRSRNPKDPAGNYRQLSVCVYNLAAEMERRIDKLGVHWVVSPEVFNAKIVLELSEDDDEQTAARFVAKVLGDMGLA
jgi:hypothetical protein